MEPVSNGEDILCVEYFPNQCEDSDRKAQLRIKLPRLARSKAKTQAIPEKAKVIHGK